MFDLRIKELFFDRTAVVSAVDKARQRVLSKFGAFVMTTARRSIRNKRRTAPGQPPAVGLGVLKKTIFFSYDPAKQSVLIGPVGRVGGFAEAPELLEYGGTITRPTDSVFIPQAAEDKAFTQTDQARQLRAAHYRRFGRRNREITIGIVPAGTHVYAAHPFMQPALDKETKQHMPQMWLDSVKRG